MVGSHLTKKTLVVTSVPLLERQEVRIKFLSIKHPPGGGMEYLLDMQGILVKYALKVHLLDWKCHYFTRGGRGLERTTLSLSHFVTIGLEGFPKGLVRVRGWSDDGQVSFR